MKLLSLEPESSASANSATSANMMSTSGIISQSRGFVKSFAKKCKEGKDLFVLRDKGRISEHFSLWRVFIVRKSRKQDLEPTLAPVLTQA